MKLAPRLEEPVLVWLVLVWLVLAWSGPALSCWQLHYSSSTRACGHRPGRGQWVMGVSRGRCCASALHERLCTKEFFNTDVLCKKFFNSAILGPALRGGTLGPLPRPSAISLYDGWMFRPFYPIGGGEKASRGRLTDCFSTSPCLGRSERSEASSFPTSGPGSRRGCRRTSRRP